MRTHPIANACRYPRRIGKSGFAASPIAAALGIARSRCPRSSMALVERALKVQIPVQLGYEPHRERQGAGNTRNGSTPKTLQTEHGPVQINTPRDRDGSFEPRLVRKRQRRCEVFDERILALYPRGMSMRISRRAFASRDRSRSKAIAGD
jgi:transposase-like protein